MKYLAWADPNDAFLQKGFSAYNGAARDYKKWSRWLRPWLVTYACYAVAFLWSLGVYLLSFHGVAWPFILVTTWIAGYYAFVWSMVILHRTRARWYRGKLRNHDYGYSIMWEVDADWLALQSALQGYGIVWSQVMADRRIRTDVVAYLADSWHVRLRLRKERLMPRPAHPLRVELSGYAETAAGRIYEALSGN